MRPEAKFPQLSKAAYFRVRAAMQRTIPAAVTSEWVIANVPGYEETSARSVLTSLRALALIDAEGAPTEVARKWRLDETYPEACEAMLRKAFPRDLVDAVSGTEPSHEVIARLLMSRGLGSGTAANVARLFILLVRKRPETAVPVPGSERTVPGQAPARAPKRRAPTRDDQRPSARSEESPSAGPSPMTVLRYFLERGRLAELRVPSDMAPSELRRLFRHLEIDLLESVQDHKENA